MINDLKPICNAHFAQSLLMFFVYFDESVKKGKRFLCNCLSVFEKPMMRY